NRRYRDWWTACRRTSRSFSSQATDRRVPSGRAMSWLSCARRPGASSAGCSAAAVALPGPTCPPGPTERQAPWEERLAAGDPYLHCRHRPPVAQGGQDPRAQRRRAVPEWVAEGYDWARDGRGPTGAGVVQRLLDLLPAR